MRVDAKFLNEAMSKIIKDREMLLDHHLGNIEEGWRGRHLLDTEGTDEEWDDFVSLWWEDISLLMRVLDVDEATVERIVRKGEGIEDV